MCVDAKLKGYEGESWMESLPREYFKVNLVCR